MKRKREIEVADESERVASDAAGWWNQLPEDLQMEILAHLPLDMMYRYRKVCDEWRTLFSSNYFISRKWAGAPMNNKYLLLCDSKPEQPCMAFCFYTRTWKVPFYLSNLWRYTQGNWNAWDIEVNFIGSAAGLILLNFPRRRLTPIVFNPYTGTSIQLPRTSSITNIMHRCIVGDINNDNNTYQVMALGYGWWDILDNQALLVEIYDSSHKTWKVAGYLPWSTIGNIIFNSDKDRMVFCDGCFYCLGDRLDMPSCILGFSVPSSNAEGSPIPVLLAPLPDLLPGFRATWVKLLTCAGSRLLVVANIFAPHEIVERHNYRGFRAAGGQVILWEFQNSSSSSSWKWNLMATMPSSVQEDFKNRFPASALHFNCIGLGNYVYFTACREANVLAYNVRESSWSWLPTCPTDRIGLNGAGIVFEPRYDMRVE